MLVAGSLTLMLVAGCVLYVLGSYASAFLLRPASRARLLRAAFVELGTALALVPFWPLWWLIGSVYRASKEGEGKARGRRNPVVMLHGFGMNRTRQGIGLSQGGKQWRG